MCDLGIRTSFEVILHFFAYSCPHKKLLPRDCFSFLIGLQHSRWMNVINSISHLTALSDKVKSCHLILPTKTVSMFCYWLIAVSNMSGAPCAIHDKYILKVLSYAAFNTVVCERQAMTTYVKPRLLSVCFQWPGSHEYGVYYTCSPQAARVY